jgi:hypothetical protein
MEEALKGVKGSVGSLAAELGLATSAFVTSMEKLGEQFEQLYFLSQRTGATADNLKAVAFAAKQVSGDAQSAINTIVELAQKARSLPPGYMRNLIRGRTGVDTADPEKQRAAILQTMYANFQKYSEAEADYRNMLLASYVGINYEAERLNAKFLPQTLKYEKELAAVQKLWGVDLKATTESSHVLMQSFRDIGIRLEVIGARIFDTWVVPLTKGLEAVSAIMDRIGAGFKAMPKPLQDVVAGGAGVVGAVGAGAVGALALRGVFRLLTGRTAAAAMVRALGAAGGLAGAGAGAGAAGAAGAGAGALGTVGGFAARRLAPKLLGGVLGGPVGMAIMAASLGYDAYELLSPMLKGGGGAGGAGGLGLGPDVQRELSAWLHGTTALIPVVRIKREQFGGYVGPDVEPGGKSPAYPGRTADELWGGAAKGRPQRHGDIFGPRRYAAAAWGSIPDLPAMAEKEKRAWEIIMADESGGQNIRNRQYNKAAGRTAQGYWMILESNWERIAPGLGIAAKTPMEASKADQLRVARELNRRRPGFGDWTYSNPQVRRDLEREHLLGVRPGPQVSLPGPQVAANTYGGARHVTVDNSTNIHMGQGDNVHVAALEQMINRQNADMIRNLSGALA